MHWGPKSGSSSFRGQALTAEPVYVPACLHHLPWPRGRDLGGPRNTKCLAYVPASSVNLARARPMPLGYLRRRCAVEPDAGDQRQALDRKGGLRICQQHADHRADGSERRSFPLGGPTFFPAIDNRHARLAFPSVHVAILARVEGGNSGNRDRRGRIDPRAVGGPQGSMGFSLDAGGESG